MAGTPPPINEHNESISFLQGNDIYERPVMKFFEGMREYSFSCWAIFIFDAQGLACIFMLLFFAVKSYEMMSGDKQLEVMPLLRPFALMMVIMWWPTVCKVIAYPTDIVANKTEALYSTQQDQINSLRLERANYIIQVGEKLMNMQASSRIAAEEAGETNKHVGTKIVESVKGYFADKIYNPIMELRIRTETSLALLLTQALETVAIWILRICVYLVFMLEILYSTILIILGPFSVALSILPAYRDTFTTWIARFVSVNLYVGLAYLVLYITGLMQYYALASEIEKYKVLLDGGGGTAEKMLWLSSNGILSFGTVIVAFIVGAIAITTVPSISTWIISTSGISSASSTAGRTASTIGAQGMMASKVLLK
jgi:hypothetical protein